MKELSIEEKAKRYDEALIRGSRLWESDMITRENYEYIFPELAESEDARIRKAIYNCVKWFGFDSCFFKDVSQEECLAWLEKKPSLLTKEKALKNSPFVEQKTADKIEPKFKAGDIIRHKEQGFTCKITAVDTEYRVSDCCGTHLPFDMQDYYELVEQKPVWSEEDEKCLENAIMYCEWARDIAPTLHCYEISEKSINWLKSLKGRAKPQSTWKPSKEQMGVIAQSVAVLKVSGYGELGDRLGDISEQLNKLR